MRLVVSLLLVVYTASAYATLIVAEPDDFAEGGDLRNAFQGITLSVDGKPGAVVRALDSTFNDGPTAGRTIASTGTKVFGHTITGSVKPMNIGPLVKLGISNLLHSS